MVVATAPAPPSRCDPARGDARPESRGASVSGVALGDAGSRGPGGGDGQGPAAAAAQEDARPPGWRQRRSDGQVTGSCPHNRVGGTPGEGNEKGWNWGWG